MNPAPAERLRTRQERLVALDADGFGDVVGFAPIVLGFRRGTVGRELPAAVMPPHGDSRQPGESAAIERSDLPDESIANQRRELQPAWLVCAVPVAPSDTVDQVR